MNPNDVARSATVHSLLNCYLREIGDHETRPGSETPIETERSTVVHISVEQGIDLYVPLRYRSPTGRHLFDRPVLVRPDGTQFHPDVVDLATAIVEHLRCTRDPTVIADELVVRVLRSAENVERFVDARRGDRDRLYGLELSFRDAEQSLVFGHLMHPTPKSRRGIPPHERATYAPELRGGFPLHYYAADPSIVEEGSARPESASSWVASWLRADPAVPEAFVAEHVESDDVLLPVHPWQATYLQKRPHVRANLGDSLEYLGPVGREFYPTSSVRTLYAPAAPFMVKGSLAVEITNSVRVNKRRELERGVAIADLLETALGEDLRERFPHFGVLKDPAFLTLTIGDDTESGFETILRDNPFTGHDASNATPIVALCQDHVDDGRSRLQRIVEALAEREGRSTAAVSEGWFERYLAIFLRPVLWLYLEWGLGLEAHQQNCVLELEDCYPDSVMYRDNQGFFFPESRYERVDALVPDIGERTATVRPDHLTDEAIVYYVLINNVFGVINAFGTAGLIDERRLLERTREELTTLRRYDHDCSSVLEDLLEARTLTCKANLLMRFDEVDELTGSVESQIVTTEIPNPLVTELDRTRGG